MAADSESVLDGDPYVTTHPSSRAFWRATAAGTLLLPRCHDCGGWHWYPRAFCPFCHSQRVALEPAAGTGRVYAFSWLEGATPLSIVAYVRLSEGPVMLTNLGRMRPGGGADRRCGPGGLPPGCGRPHGPGVLVGRLNLVHQELSPGPK